MRAYRLLLWDLLEHGIERTDRTGVGTLSDFGGHAQFDLREGFPLLTERLIAFKTVAMEMLWFLRGDVNTEWLEQQGVKIWRPWASESGHVGPIYGFQWRNFGAAQGKGIDQVKEAIRLVKEQPDSRRILVSAWNPVDLEAMALPPCPVLFQLYVDHGEWLHMHVYQRSCDAFIGLPHDIAGYALLLAMIARTTGLLPGRLNFSFGDLHLYKNHVDHARELLKREPRPLPVLKIDGLNDDGHIKQIDDFQFQDFSLVGYHPHPAIKADVAV